MKISCEPLLFMIRYRQKTDIVLPRRKVACGTVSYASHAASGAQGILCFGQGCNTTAERKRHMSKEKGFVAEFKKFILRGNVMDMAVGVIVGGAFTAIVTSLNKDILTPILGIFGGTDFSNLYVQLTNRGTTYATIAEAQEAGEAVLAYGNFITAILNFLITALVIFMLVKLVNKLAELGKKKEEEPAPAAPTTKVCPYCKSEIPIDATKCAHCTSDVE